MKNKKILLYYLLEFILTIFIFLTIILLILRLTILNKNYFIKTLEKNNYYNELYLDINNDFENYIMQSGFDIKIVDNLFTEDSLKKVINNNVDNFYKGKEIKVDTNNIKENLNNNINIYLESNNIRVTDEKSLNLFINEIINIYKNRIIINDKFIKLSNIFYKINKLVNIGTIILFILDIILLIFLKFIFKKIILTIPVLSSLFILILGYFLILDKININNIVFWNNYVSSIIKSIFLSISALIKYIVIIGIIIELIKLIIIYIRKSRKN